MTDCYLTEDLIRSVRLRTRIGTAQIPGARDSDIILLLNEEMKTLILPSLLKPKEDYFVRTFRIDLVAGKSRYRIPPRAAGLKLRAMYHLSSTGSRSRTMKRQTRMDRINFAQEVDGIPSAFLLEGAYIVILPDEGSAYSGKLEVEFYMRPGNLVDSSEYFKIASVDSTTQITLESSVPSEWTTAYIYDIHSSESGCEVKAWDRTVTSISGSTVVFASPIDGSVWGDYPVVAGDYFVKASTSAMPQLPSELHTVLALASSAALTGPLDPELSAKIQMDLQRALSAAGYLFDIRAEGGSQINVGLGKNPAFG